MGGRTKEVSRVRKHTQKQRPTINKISTQNTEETPPPPPHKYKTTHTTTKTTNN